MATAASSFPRRVLARLRHTGHQGGRARPASRAQRGSAREHRACHGGHCPGPCVRTARPRPGKGRARTARLPPRPRPRGSQSRERHGTAQRAGSAPTPAGRSQGEPRAGALLTPTPSPPCSPAAEPPPPASPAAPRPNRALPGSRAGPARPYEANGWAEAGEELGAPLGS